MALLFPLSIYGPPGCEAVISKKMTIVPSDWTFDPYCHYGWYTQVQVKRELKVELGSNSKKRT